MSKPTPAGPWKATAAIADLERQRARYYRRRRLQRFGLSVLRPSRLLRLYWRF